MNLRAGKVDVAAGAMFIAIGALFLIVGWNYEAGSLLRMGAGFFPQVLACLLIFLGAVVGARGLLREDGSRSDGQWREGGAAIILLSIVLFGILIRGAGLYIALPGAVFLSAYASRHFRPIPALVLAVSVTIFVDLVFRHALGTRIPVLGTWF